ncbi:(S)-2-haloacid dehalogenase [Collimonas arenae]|uniref:(S)-2-haloacid dehalogenase n=1 Tax=Collimonas arenae TaxID=279058 RepID=A0A0A1FGE2_9BURK|nr:haloacid dehalogenase type II [Collimonas arenae]AIY41952.1 (S)-2-haloacid dehalogenase [Collimonas arenae]
MEKIRGIVFDLYGTLYDVHSVAGLCDTYHPGRGLEISTLWRQKQLEYTWLRSLMGQYVDFEQATRDALLFTSRYLTLPLDDAARMALCDAYLKIKPYPEVPEALDRLQAMHMPLAILSNGSAHSIRSVVTASGLAHRFQHLISADSAQIFKPHHSVYKLAEDQLQQDRSAILFVSSNAWDASGARHFGYPVCWINRAGNPFDELGQSPDHVVAGLDQLVHWFEERIGAG